MLGIDARRVSITPAGTGVQQVLRVAPLLLAAAVGTALLAPRGSAVAGLAWIGVGILIWPLLLGAVVQQQQRRQLRVLQSMAPGVVWAGDVNHCASPESARASRGRIEIDADGVTFSAGSLVQVVPWSAVVSLEVAPVRGRLIGLLTVRTDDQSRFARIPWGSYPYLCACLTALVRGDPAPTQLWERVSASGPTRSFLWFGALVGGLLAAACALALVVPGVPRGDRPGWAIALLAFGAVSYACARRARPRSTPPAGPLLDR